MRSKISPRLILGSIVLFTTFCFSTSSLSRETSERLRFVEYRLWKGLDPNSGDKSNPYGHSFIMLGSINSDGTQFEYDRGYGFWADQSNPNFNYFKVATNQPVPSYMLNEERTHVNRFKRFYVTENQYVAVKTYAKYFEQGVQNEEIPWRTLSNNCNTFVKNTAGLIGLRPSVDPLRNVLLPDYLEDFLNGKTGINDLRQELLEVKPDKFIDQLISDFNHFDALAIGYDQMELDLEEYQSRIAPQQKRLKELADYAEAVKELLANRAFLRSVLPGGDTSIRIPILNQYSPESLELPPLVPSSHIDWEGKMEAPLFWRAVPVDTPKPTPAIAPPPPQPPQTLDIGFPG